MKKQIKVENEKVEIKVDFKMVWAFMWRFYLIVLGSIIAYALLVSIIFTI